MSERHAPFYDPREFEFPERLEESWREIREDYRRVEGDLVDWHEKKLYREGWKVFPLFDFPNGEPIDENIAKCPFTASLLREYVPDHGVAGFSTLKPMTTVVPHQGYQGDFLRCHLGLQIPSGDCALRLESATRSWENGKVLIFDDRLTHEAWNRTREDRVVLLVDFVPRN